MNRKCRLSLLATTLLAGPLHAADSANGPLSERASRALQSHVACDRLRHPVVLLGAYGTDRRTEPEHAPAGLARLGAASAALFRSGTLHDCRSQWDDDDKFSIKPGKSEGRWEATDPGIYIGGRSVHEDSGSARPPADVIIHQTRLDRAGGVPLCDGERFKDRPRGAFCSGALVGPDLVLTAAHCVTADKLADGISIVFGYDEAAAQHGAVSHTQVYRLKDVVASELGDSLEQPDWALVRLDRPVEGGKPLALEPAEPAPGARVATMGYPQGLPLKFDPDGRVVSLDLKAGMLATDLSVFGGNSGGPVLDEAGHVVAVVDTAASDMALDPWKGCAKTHVIKDPAKVSALAGFATLTRTVLRHAAASRALGRAGARSLALDSRRILGNAGDAAGSLGGGAVPDPGDAVPAPRRTPAPAPGPTPRPMPSIEPADPRQTPPPVPGRPASPGVGDAPAAPPLRPGDRLPPAAQPPAGWRLIPLAPPAPPARMTPAPQSPRKDRRGWWSVFRGALGAEPSGGAR